MKNEDTTRITADSHLLSFINWLDQSLITDEQFVVILLWDQSVNVFKSHRNQDNLSVAAG